MDGVDGKTRVSYDRFGSTRSDADISREEISRHRRLLSSFKSSESGSLSFQSPVCFADSDSDGDNAKNRKGRKRRRKLNWRDVDPVALSGPKYCPEVIAQYVEKKSNDLSVDVKKHLFSIGWRIAFLNDEDIVKFRYTSPAGKSYFSLVKVCQHLKGSAPSMLQKVGQEDESKYWNDDEEKATEVDDGFTDLSPSPASTCTDVLVADVDEDLQLSDDNRKLAKTLNLGDGINEEAQGRKDLSYTNEGSKCSRPPTVNSSRRNSRTILSLLMDNKILFENDRVYYGNGKNHSPVAWGKITDTGILCDCCSEIFTLSSFEAHANSSKHRPAENLFLEDGRSLFVCKMQLMNSKKETKLIQNPDERTIDERLATENDQICSVCHYGGELILCDGCPSSFHSNCLGLKVIPEGDWFCPSCCCEICRQGKWTQLSEHQTDENCSRCHQCDRKYHVGCLRSKGEVEMNKLSSNGKFFCSAECESVFLALGKLLGRQISVGDDNLTWTLLKSVQNLETEAMAETRSKLNTALSVMHECFEPVKDSVTNGHLIEDVIFSKESVVRRLNFKGFYTVILERDDELISAATVRVYGEKVAEVPLVGTRFRHRRLGMCRVLMNELEKQLVEMGVERLVLPAAPSALATWTGGSFGFSPMAESERLGDLNFTFLNFQETIMCHKLLSRSSANGSPSPAIFEKSEAHLPPLMAVKIQTKW